MWRKKCGGLGPSELKRLGLLEEENRELKQMMADLSLDKAMLQEVVTEKVRGLPSDVLSPPTYYAVPASQIRSESGTELPAGRLQSAPTP